MSSNISFRLSLCTSLCLILLAANLGFAQGAKPTPSTSVLSVTSAEQLRFIALGEVYQMRLEIFSTTGEKLFDSDFKSGNLLDWKFQDQQGQRLPDGAYRCVVTTKSLTGQVSQKHGVALSRADQITLQAPGPDAQAIQTANSLTTIAQSESLTGLGKEGVLPLTLLAHDGERGQVMSGRGGLSFRTGDFFTGTEREQMRLTPEGRLGLGVVEPQAKLDVGGLIRTSEGVVFPDGSVQTTAYVASGRSLGERTRTQRDAQGRTVAESDESGKLAASENKAQLAPEISGTGTTNRITKWTNGPTGVVGDSIITEVGGNIGIGTTNPAGGFDYRGSTAAFYTRDIGPTNFGTAQSALQLGVSNLHSRNVGVGPSMLFHAENSAGAKSFLGRVSAVWENPMAGAEAGTLFFQVRANSGDGNALTERMRITAAGNVGIGTTTPGAKLDVAGTINATTQYNLGGNRVISQAGPDNLFVGFNTGTANNSGSSNSFFGRDAGTANTSGSSNSFFGRRAGFLNNGGGNAFFGSDTGANNTNGYDNAFFGTAAGHKNQGGNRNVFLGMSAGFENTSGFRNVFLGHQAGYNNKGADSNVFIGGAAGVSNMIGTSNVAIGTNAGDHSLGNNNVYIGSSAGTSNHTGNNNTIIGNGADVAGGEQVQNNATAIGYKARVDCDNCIVLGDFNANIKVGIGLPNPQARLHVSGTIKTNVLQIDGADFSENFDVGRPETSGSKAVPPRIEAGLVVSIDPHNPGKLVISSQAYDRRVAGILSGAGHINTGIIMGQPGSLANGAHPVALSGRVYCMADTSFGAIKPGDLLTTSTIPGHAMKVRNYSRAQGAIIGKAMTSLKKGKGLVLVLVTLQ